MKTDLKSLVLDFDPFCNIIGELDFDNLALDLRFLKSRTCTFAESIEFLNQNILKNNVSCIITTQRIFDDLFITIGIKSDKSFITTKNPKEFFFLFHNYLSQNGFYKSKSFPSQIHPTAKISKLASIASENVIIEAYSVIEEFVVIKENVTIGKHSVIQSGTVIGNSCIQCIKLDDNSIIDIEHVGGVIIGSSVKIESNSVICKHIFNDNTSIGNDSKISGLSHITHGCRLGNRVVVTPNVVICGSTIIEDDVFIGPNTTIAPMLTINKDARITMGSVVTKDVGLGEHITGNFAIPHSVFINNLKKNLE